MPIITSVEQQKKDKTRCSVYLDGAFYCGLKIEVAVKYRLKKGMEIEKSELDAIQLDNEKVQATERAMTHLSATPKTRRQMSDFLTGKGYTQPVVDYVLEKLESYGYIDDYNYCRSYAEGAKGKGKNAIRAALIKRGASREAIDETLSRITEDGDEMLAVAKKYMRGKEYTDKNLAKALRYLVSRGYGYDEAKSAISRLGEEE